MVPDLRALPGGDLVMTGLHDIQSGRPETVAALLVHIGATRLAYAGISIPQHGAPPDDAELRLYGLLASDGEPDPYGRYNALIRRLVSCEAALVINGVSLSPLIHSLAVIDSFAGCH